MTVFTRTWNAAYEAQPAGSDQASGGAAQIRNLKTDIQERIEVDHSFIGDANDGKHLHVTMMPAVGVPATDPLDGSIYAITLAGKTELFYKDSAGASAQLTRDGGVNPAFAGSGSFAGNLQVGGLTVVGTALFANDPLFSISKSGGNYIFQVTSNTFFEFNSGAAQWQFFVGGVLVGTFP